MSAAGAGRTALARRAPRWLLLAALTAGCACGGHAAPLPLLRSYRLQLPRHQLGRVTWLAQLASDEFAGTLSPDGQLLAYASDQKGQLDIWVKSLVTGLPRRITDDPAEDTQPAWSPDGRALAFVSMRADAKGDLYLWRDGRLQRLTDARTADAFPTFAPDGRSLYYSAGEPGRERVQRLVLATGHSEAVTTSGATHPALSADGRWLAYTRSTAGGVARVEVLRLGSPPGRAWAVTSAEDPAGFPAFTADGRWLVFCRFRRGAAPRARRADTPASLWRVPLDRVVEGRGPEATMARAEQLTSDGTDALLPRAHALGLVITARHAGSLDLGLLPTSGLVPTALPPAALRTLARSEREPWARLLLWQHLARDGSYGGEAQYASAQLWLELGEDDKARRALRALAAAQVSPKSEAAVFVARAQIDLALLPRLPLAAATGATSATAPAAASPDADDRRQQDARAALGRVEQLRLHLFSTAAAVRGYLLLREAELEQRALHLPVALARYQALIDQYPEQRELVTEAQLQLGAIYARLQTPELVARYYLGLLEGGDRLLAEAVAKALIALRATEPLAAQREGLRALLDRPGLPSAVAVRLLGRLAQLHEEQAELDPAIEALAAALQQRDLGPELAAELGFDLGRLALRRSHQLRQAGQPAAALAHYERALQAYARILRESDPASETHAAAERAHLRLALLDAAQLAHQGARARAEQRYRQLLTVDDGILQAHRGLLAIGATTAQRAADPRAAWAALAAPYRRRAQRDAGDAVALYALGYLATLRAPLRPGDLDEAERWLKRALTLRPQSPFGHMTLGWVYEVRERYFGARQGGWLEEAALAYEQAHALNDAVLDPQTEADLLVNLANVFAALGNGWREVVGYCAQRRALAQPFGTPEQEAFHRLSCGRAAAATGAYALAARELEVALRLAQGLGLDGLEVQVLAQLGVSEQLRGALASSSRWLLQAVERVQRKGHEQALAPLQRTLAYNAVLQRDGRRAAEQLRTAEQALKHWGTAAPPSFLPVAPRPEPSTTPLGLDLVAEHQVQIALREIMAQQQLDGPRATRLQEQLISAQEQRLGAQDLVELRRELLLLRNRAGLLGGRLGDRAAYAAALDRALREARVLREPEGELDLPSFAFEVGLALNRADALLDTLAAGAPVAPSELQACHALLRELEQRRAAGRAPTGASAPATTAEPELTEKPLLSQRLRLALWTDLALFTLQLTPELASAAPNSPAGPAGEPSTDVIARLQDGWAAGPPRTVAERAVHRLLTRLQPVAQAVRLLQAVLAETDPAVTPLTERAADAPAPGGISDALWRPLSADERRHWHLAVALALARVGGAAVAPAALEAHPSTEVLRRVAAANVTEDLGAQRYALSAELAYRRRDARAAAAAVDGLLERHPLLLARADLAEAAALRSSVFGPAIALAFDQGDAAAALRYAELAERRAFVDELITLGPAGGGPVGGALRRLLERAAEHRRHAGQPPPSAPTAAAAPWRDELQRRQRAVEEALRALARVSPAVADLLTVGDFELSALQRALEPETVALRLVDDGARVALLSVRPRGAPRLQLLPQRLAVLRALPAAARARLLSAPLLAAARSAGRLLLDLGPLDDAPLTAAALGLDAQRVVRLATLWELLDAQAVRRLPLPTIVHVARAAPEGEAPAAKDVTTPGWRPLRAASLSGAALEQASARSGLLWLDLPQRWLGSSAANLALDRGPGQTPWRWAHQLGLLLDSTLAVLPEAGLTGPGRRAQLVALLRLLHAAGVATVALGAGEPQTPVPPALASPRALPAAWARAAGLPLTAALAPLGLTIFGDPGVDPAARQRFAQTRLRTLVFAGAKAFNAQPRQLAAAIGALQPALHYMTFLSDARLQPGALLYLANAHGLREDYPRALAPMAELVALRRAALAAAKGGQQPRGPALLRAQAELVTALRQMAWLRLRNEQFDAALAANAETIAIYEQVRRPALLREALEQRSTIAEHKGAHDEALRAARRSLGLAASGTEPPSVAGDGRASAKGLATAQDALRVAQLLRVRFARFREAAATVERALRALPELGPEHLPRASAAWTPLRPTVALVAAAWLELARIASARGVFSDGVRLARRALALLEAAGLPSDAALLELVNGLYYSGALAEALEAAERGLSSSAKDPARRLQLLNARGTTLAALGRSTEALATLQRALAEARQQGRDSEIAAALNNLGFAQRLAGHAGEAARSFGAALELDRARGDALGTSFALANRGLALLQLDRQAEAREDLQQALTLAQQIHAALNELKAHHGLGSIELAAGRPALALEHAQAGLQRARQVGQRAWVWRFGLQRSRALRALGRTQEARQALEESAALVDSLPAQPGQATSGGGGEEPRGAVYDELVDLLATLGQAEAALAVAERARARAGRDGGGAALAELRAPPVGEPLQRLLELQRHLEALRCAQLQASGDRHERALLRTEAAEVSQQLAQARAALGALQPRLLRLLSPAPWDPAAVASGLRREGPAIAVVYYATAQRLVSWVVRPTESERLAVAMSVVPLPRARLTAAVAALRAGLQRWDDVAPWLRQLSTWLIRPLAGAAGAEARQWLVVAPEPLADVPFAALTREGATLAERVTLTHLPALAWLGQPVASAPAPERGAWVSVAWEGETGRPLPLAVRESEALGRTAMEVTAYTGGRATRQALQEALISGRQVHLATHVDSGAAPLGRVVALADGGLSPLELLATRVNAPLIVLSACEAARSLAAGRLALDRLLLLAGAGQVLATTERVSDLGAALLMKHFFRARARGLAPAAALQQAQLRLRARWPYPAAWATFRVSELGASLAPTPAPSETPGAKRAPNDPLTRARGPAT